MFFQIMLRGTHAAKARPKKSSVSRIASRQLRIPVPS
jgi:hypothetical protein